MLSIPLLVVLHSLSTSPASPAESGTATVSAEATQARAAARAVVAAAALPASIGILQVVEEEDATRVILEGDFVPFDADAEDALMEGFAGAYVGFALTKPLILEVATATGVRPLGGLPVVEHDRARARRPKAPTRTPPKERASDRFPFGSALLGYRIALSAGHGWLPDGAGWRTQRDRWTGCSGCRGIVEDFFTQELVSRQVMPLLQQMGAEIVLMRDPNLQANVPRQIVDDGDPGYSEQGEWNPGTSTGWAGTYRTNADTDLGSASFAVPMTSETPVRVGFRYLEGQNRTTAAIVNVNHAGGTRTFNIDQTKMGQHWLDLGEYVMGQNGSVDVAHGPAAGFLIADAVKVGGGIWSDSGNPAWEMSAQEFIRWNGAPSSVTSRSDVTIRPAFAETANPDLYISIHANASGVSGGSSANGISTYRYSCQSYPNFTTSAAATACDDPPGSTALINDVHAALVDSLRQDWDPNFGNRGTLVANFGEIRELDDTPGILIETAFFDNDIDPAGSPPPVVNDNTALHTPQWREAFARGLAEGIAQHLTGGHVPPERPVALAARNERNGTMTVSWAPVEGALGYKVYTARLGRAFDEGTVVEDATSLVIDDATPREVLVFKVAALDTNGEGFSSAAVGARFRGAQLSSTVAPSSAVLVNAYDRRDARVQDQDNQLDYAVELAHAFGSTDADIYFDGVLDELIDSNPSALAPYDVVLWNCGKDSTFHQPFSPEARDAIEALHARGGSVFASGEEIGWALVQTSDDPADEAFLADVFGATFEADDAATYSATPVGVLDSVPALTFDDGSAGVYEVKFPDVFAAISPATVGLTYPDSSGAAIVTDRTVVMGFPLETVVPSTTRNALARAVLNVLIPSPSRNDVDGDGANDACETANGFDWRDDADGTEARQLCGNDVDGGPSPEPEPEPEPEPGVDGGEPEEPEPSEDGGVEPEVTPEPAPSVPTPDPEPVDRFNIAPEPACACTQPTPKPPAAIALVLFALGASLRRRRQARAP